MANLLVVDDEQSIRDVLRMALEDEGHEVTLADGGRQAREYIRQHSYQLIITDLVMPDVDGIAVINFAKMKNPGTRILAITGGGRADSKHYVKQAQDLGVLQVVMKPFDLDQIIQVVSELLGDNP